MDKSILNLNNRKDCFLIWPHGLQYLEEILSFLDKQDFIEIDLIKRKKVRSIRRFVKCVYSFDYAPWVHLKNKTRYLMDQGDEVAFIFVTNKYPDIDIVDIGDFRHEESLSVKKIKERIRELFNPRSESGKLTHDHVIHATDNQSQTMQMFGLAGVKAKDIYGTDRILNVPWFLSENKSFKITEIEPQNLVCTQVSGNGKVEIVSIFESKQYQFLKGKEVNYRNYIADNLGVSLLSYYSIEKFDNLKQSFSYLSPPFDTNYILVKKVSEGVLVLDGLHRASLCLFHDYKKILVCELL